MFKGFSSTNINHLKILENYENKYWNTDTITSKRVKIANDVLRIEPIQYEDFATYQCIYEDEYGQHVMSFKVDSDKLNAKQKKETQSPTNTTKSSIVNSQSRVIELDDVQIEIDYASNRNDIRLKCKTSLGIKLILLIKLMIFRLKILYKIFEKTMINLKFRFLKFRFWI